VAEAAYRYLYERRRPRFSQPSKGRNGLPCKIVSVGNITVGGTGKTPAVQWVARLLQTQGVHVAVVARGYGGTLSAQGALVSDGTQISLDAKQVGDEPLLHARALPGAIVAIGRDREATVQRAVEAGAQVVVLDDAFQYWSLHRDFDLVLVDARRPFDNGRLLPVGRLREPPETLERADAILLTRSDLATDDEIRTTRAVVAYHTKAPIFEARHAPVGLRDEQSGARLELSDLEQLPVVALSAIADNVGFAHSLNVCGARIVQAVGRRDHHHWKAWELQRVAREGQRHGVRVVVTTEKDAVKIDPSWLHPLQLWSLSIELRLERDEVALQELILTAVGLRERTY
jgi:tetraacyldisaccharide 4'-kinase